MADQLQQRREKRANQATFHRGIEGGGIDAAMNMSPQLGFLLRALANTILVTPFPGSSLTRAQREILATAASVGNDCFYCMDSHATFAIERLAKAGVINPEYMVAKLKQKDASLLDPYLQALVSLVWFLQEHRRAPTNEENSPAISAGATEGDFNAVIFIASAFAMYNSLVDFSGAPTSADEGSYDEDAEWIGEYGYLPQKHLNQFQALDLSL